jgi:imidazole glycerol-phosphate synthase subunit HisH
MGWNALRIRPGCPLFEGIEDGTPVYFVHSYYCRPQDPAAAAAWCTHGIEFTAALGMGSVYAVQFHPEKSGAAGLRILANFASL